MLSLDELKARLPEGYTLNKELPIKVYTNGKKMRMFEVICNYRHTIEVRREALGNPSCESCRAMTGPIHEIFCRKVLEQLFDKEFPKIRPSWLKYKGNLELDGYNEELQIAFEYNGGQHYDPTHFHQNDITFEDLQKRDEYKIKICQERNIRLIIIPYTVAKDDIPNFIIDELAKYNITPPNQYTGVTIHNEKIKKVKAVCEKKGGKCLDDYVFLLAKDKLTFECAEGHKWDAVAANITNSKNWCQQCSDIRRRKEWDEKHIKDIERICAEKGGTYEIGEIKNTKTYLTIICNECTKPFKTTIAKLKEGVWCHGCQSKVGAAKGTATQKRKAMNKIDLIAAHFGGERKSEYINRNTKLDFICGAGGHKITHTPDHLLNHRFRWCKECNLFGHRKEIIPN